MERGKAKYIAGKGPQKYIPVSTVGGPCNGDYILEKATIAEFYKNPDLIGHKAFKAKEHTGGIHFLKVPLKIF